MLATDPIYKGIVKRLTHYTANVRTLSKSNLNDQAVLSEGFFVDLLNSVYSYSLQNRNLMPNSDTLDLADVAARVCVQVTVRTDRPKITDTVKSFIDKGYQKHFDTLLFVLIADERPEFEKFAYTEISFTKTKNIISMAEICSQIAAMSIDHMQRVADIVQKYIYYPDVSTDSSDLRARRLWLSISTLQNLLWQLVTPDFLRNTPFRPDVAYGPACDALDDVKSQRNEIELDVSEDALQAVNNYINKATCAIREAQSFIATQAPGQTPNIDKWGEAENRKIEAFRAKEVLREKLRRTLQE